MEDSLAFAQFSMHPSPQASLGITRGFEALTERCNALSLEREPLTFPAIPRKRWWWRRGSCDRGILGGVKSAEEGGGKREGRLSQQKALCERSCVRVPGTE